MLKNYKYIETDHNKLHQYMLAFFERISTETSDFNLSFFPDDFIEVAARHRGIIMGACSNIYNKMIQWDSYARVHFVNLIKESNQIEEICKGNIKPLRLRDIPSDIRELVGKLFNDLYSQVLDGDPFSEHINSRLKDHFDAFRNYNSDITLCPICGINELRIKLATLRDQYDHYLPLSIYPFSAVNFKNLVPVCAECNSLEVKGDTDIISVSTGKLFYLYDENHKGIIISFQIIKDSSNIDEIEWSLGFANPDGKTEEIDSWKYIYKIDIRYVGLVKGRILKWYKHYWEFMHDKDMGHISDDDRKFTYFKYMEKDESLQLSFIRKPAIDGFLNGSLLAKAEIEAKYYS